MPRRSDGGGDGPKPVPKPEKGATRKGEPMEQDSPNIFNAGKKLEVERPDHGTFLVNTNFLHIQTKLSSQELFSLSLLFQTRVDIRIARPDFHLPNSQKFFDS